MNEVEMVQAEYRSTDPVTGEVHEHYAVADEVQSVLAQSWQAHLRWAARPVAERAAALARIAEVFTERADELATTMRREMGKPLAEGREEGAYCRSIFAHYAEAGPRLLSDSPIATETDGDAVLQLRAVGPLLGIMPWNYPAYQVARFVAPNLLLGNTVVIKHAESTPGSALLIAQMLAGAGLLDGAYTNVFASYEQVEQMIADERIRGVSLTGSERAGAAVGASAGRHLKKCVLELGGSDPFIVLDTEDPHAMADLAWDTRMYNNGQSCNSNKRLIVHESIHDAFVQRLEFRASSAALTESVPMASRPAAERVAAQVATAVDDGARVVGRGLGEGPGAWFGPVVLSGVTDRMRVHREEIFGPVAVVYRITDDREAIAVANDSPYGLGAAVFSSDPDRASAVADALDVGMVSVNSVGADGPELPFGGVKRSGFGRELGALGLAEFANRRLFRRAPAATAAPV